ncbi:Protein of unknown function (DUF3757) [Pseudomonas sp. GM21]|jgi:hypothetical protein|uniref:DUF3757 domain-containing protein n=1 Tax=Pseudomonas sp. GM21 TaxID=1144325 RepID=UPI0002722974|nr:DUF3757 domain-containing protein [Pseudomonas sp. GM21]EJM14280.1 Protein of unknown function (DUF3757) [Pseudomonas sp. GM21]
MKRIFVVGALVLAALANNSYAATCPEVSEIIQSPMSGGGFSYQAPFPTGTLINWTGGDKWTGEGDIKTLAFTSVRIQPETIDRVDPKKTKQWAVICRYEGQGKGNEEANATMVLKPGRRIEADSDNWKTPALDASGEATAPVGTLDCTSEEPNGCKFK